MRFRPPLLAWRAWSRLLRIGRGADLIRPDARLYGISYDDDTFTPTDRVRYDACITVPEDFTGAEGLGEHCLPGGLFAVTTYEGSLPGLVAAWKQFADRWLPASGYTWRDERFHDRYHVPYSIWSRPGLRVASLVVRLRVDLCIPIEKGRPWV